MGDVICPDQALSIPIMIVIFRQLELEWEDPQFKRFQVACEGAIYLIGFCCGLKGEEIPKADLQGRRVGKATHPMLRLLYWDDSRGKQGYVTT